MADKTKRDKVIGQIIAYLKHSQAQDWTIEDKGVLVAAVKQQLIERPKRG